MTRPVVLDVIAGVGGLALGFEQAGFDVVGALEVDPIHAATHSFNFPRCRTLCDDVTVVQGVDIRRCLPVPIDFVVGGAPSQGFSMIGQRALDDPRNQLVKHFRRLVVELEPSVFVLENVRGLTFGKHRQLLDEATEEFQAAGYSVALPWHVLNARDYGVPQDRQRLFLMGAKGLPAPRYPAPETVSPPPTCRDALDDLPDAERFQELTDSDSVRVPAVSAGLSAYAREMRCLSNDAWHYGYGRAWDRHTLTASLRTAHTDISRRRFRDTPRPPSSPYSGSTSWLQTGRPTRYARERTRPAAHSPAPDRSTTATTAASPSGEMACLHGFPDWFRFHVTKWHRARQIGNAVPPPLAKAVAESVLDALGFEPTQPAGSIPLGSPELLNMGMTEASAHWGVDAPIAKRDRKSGARKRKQQDIGRELARAGA